MLNPPKWAPNAIATPRGWVDPKTGELLVSVKGLKIEEPKVEKKKKKTTRKKTKVEQTTVVEEDKATVEEENKTIFGKLKDIVS